MLVAPHAALLLLLLPPHPRSRSALPRCGGKYDAAEFWFPCGDAIADVPSALFPRWWRLVESEGRGECVGERIGGDMARVFSGEASW